MNCSIFFSFFSLCCLPYAVLLAQPSPPPLLSSDALKAERQFFSIQQALESPDGVYKLFADEFTDSPEEVFNAIPKLPKLQSIHLSGTLFYELPKELLNIKAQIQEVGILDNEVVLWDKVFGQLASFPNLEHLHLQLPREQPLPASICQLKQLKRLTINESQIDSLPACLCELKQLVYLDLRSSGLRQLPQGIGKLKNLQALYLGASPEAQPNPIASLPPSLSQLSKLRHLDLAYLTIRELPDLSKMKKLEWLHLEHCRQLNAAKLLAELANARQLQYLNLNEVPLKTLPKTIFNWQKIQTLSLRYCGLSFFPTKGSFPKLKILDLSGNAFDEPSKARLQQKFGTGMLEEFKL